MRIQMKIKFQLNLFLEAREKTRILSQQNPDP